MSKNYDKVKENQHRTQLVYDFLDVCESQGISVIKIIDPDDKVAVREAYGCNQYLKIGVHQALGILRDNLDTVSGLDDYVREAATIEDFLKHQRDQGIHLVYFIDRADYVYEEFTPRMDDMLYSWIGVNGRRFEREKEKKITGALAACRTAQEAESRRTQEKEEDERLAGSATSSDDGHQQRDSGTGVDSAAGGSGEDSPNDEA